ncbi:MAG: SIS domain-containing protein [Thiolinea sp.]
MEAARAIEATGELSQQTPVYATLMATEAAETPYGMQRQLAEVQETLSKLSKRLQSNPPRLIVTCGRGSSDHAGVFARYILELGLGIPTTSATPSTLSVYGVETQLKDCLVLLISQSGESPDLVNYAESAQRSGALTVGLINCDTSAPLAKHCDYVLPLCAGPEQAVAATKSYLCTLFLALQIKASWTANQNDQLALQQLPEHMQQARALDWTVAVDTLEAENNLLVLGRGPGLGVAHEIALKFKETCGLHAESFSAAEVLHGPLAMIKSGFPVLILDQGDESAASISTAARRLLAAGATVLMASAKPVKGCIMLPVLKEVAPDCALLTQVQSAYFMIEALSRRRGYCPDAPAHIAKVTKTL